MTNRATTTTMSTVPVAGAKTITPKTSAAGATISATPVAAGATADEQWEMTDFEIGRAYRLAKDPEMMIDILADLNAVSRRKMRRADADVGRQAPRRYCRVANAFAKPRRLRRSRRRRRGQIYPARCQTPCGEKICRRRRGTLGAAAAQKFRLLQRLGGRRAALAYRKGDCGAGTRLRLDRRRLCGG